MQATEARQIAIDTLAKFNKGIGPNQESKIKRTKTVTLGDMEKNNHPIKFPF